jgi:PEP-CTERM motif
MKKFLVSAMCVAVLASVSLAGQVIATDIAKIQSGSPDTNYYVFEANTICNPEVLVFNFDISSIIADTGAVADAAGSLELQAQWAESLDWQWQAIATDVEFDQTTVTWNSYTGSNPAYFDALPVEDTQQFPASGNFVEHGFWAISQAAVQSWIDNGGIASVALKAAPGSYSNVCHWTNETWNSGAMPRLNVTTTPEPATMALVALGGLAFLRRRK